MPAIESDDQSLAHRHLTLVTASPSQQSQPSTVHQLPEDRLRPLWLQLLLNVQHGSSVVMAALACGVLVAYVQTVQTQQQWGRAYRRLEVLQRQERQLLSAGALLQEQLDRPSNSLTKELEPLTLSQAIFIKPQPVQSSVAVPPKSSAPPGHVPLAY
ncbi:MAG: hypothetical protein NZ772_08450 [Cyanobacteria bacterium]|nr:hypothetical protein [Cyanobacteriota bacterium]MDW8201507.1 hypothetical protein [Cyanobacteriota bacterium SKYGB_h_bin112]